MSDNNFERQHHCLLLGAAKRLILLDRDGVINEDVGAPGVIDVSQLCLTPHAGKAIAKLKKKQLTTTASDASDQKFHSATSLSPAVVMITNQSCVGKGIITESQLDVIQDTVQQLLLDQDSNARLDRIYQCTSTRQDDDPRMKPAPGMMLEAMRDFQVSPENCCFVGDTITDLQAAAAAGVSLRILVATGYGQGLMDGRLPPEDRGNGGDENVSVIHCQDPDDAPKFPESVFPFVYCRNLEHAVKYILTCEEQE